MAESFVHGIKLTLPNGRRVTRWYPGATRAWVNGYVFGLSLNDPESRPELVTKGGRGA